MLGARALHWVVVVIGKDAREVIEKTIGLSLSSLYELNPHEEITHVKKKTGKDVAFPGDCAPLKAGRGSALLARKKVTTMEEINAGIDAL